MKIDNEELSSLYQEESGKLLLGLSTSRFNQYVEIINSTKSFRGVIDSIPPDLSNLEKAYYIYNKLGILLYENNSLVYNHIENLGMYYSTIRHNGIGNCRQMSELYVTMLTMSDVIERFYLTRKPVGVEGLDLRHIDAIIQVDGKLYMTDIIRDTVNMRAGIKNMKFGYIDTVEKRIHELSKFINANKIINLNQKNRLIELIKQKNFEEFIRYFGELETEYATDFGLEFLKRKLPKIEFASQIKEQIGELTEVPKSAEDGQISIDYLDKKLGFTRNYNDIGFPFNIKLGKYHYFEEILDEVFIPQMANNDSCIRRGWSYSNNILPSNSLDENIELDIDIILDFFYKVAPEMDSEICLKYLKYVLWKIYSTRDYNGRTIDKEWINKNIKLYKTIKESVIKNNSDEFPLQTMIVVRKSEVQKKKYIFYKIEDGLKHKKVLYREMIEELKGEKTKICSKFSTTRRKDFVEELEI